jgi:hypothetical protein
MSMVAIYRRCENETKVSRKQVCTVGAGKMPIETVNLEREVVRLSCGTTASKLVLHGCLAASWLVAASPPVLAQSQELPPPNVVRAIAAQYSKRFPATNVRFEPGEKKSTVETCEMTPAIMRVERDARRRSLSVLVDSPRVGKGEPKDIFARILRMTVDADGSMRSYHPDDPFGEGVCGVQRDTKGRAVFDGVCSLDNLASGGFRLFRDAQRLKRNTIAPSEDLEGEWRAVWPLIRDKKLRPFNLGSLTGEKALERYYGFYEKSRRVTALFNDQIIPKDDLGYPCRHGPDTPQAGYFISATTLSSKEAGTNDQCTAFSFIDAEHVPFFVLPAGRLGQAGVGDVVVGYLRVDGHERLAFGIAADTGPFDQLGEGSVAFNQRLIGKSDIVMNAKGVYGVDIDLKARAYGKEKSAAMAVLVLGGTRHLLKGDYSPGNVEKISRQEFARWGGSNERALERLRSCVAAAPANVHR